MLLFFVFNFLENDEHAKNPPIDSVKQTRRRQSLYYTSILELTTLEFR